MNNVIIDEQNSYIIGYSLAKQKVLADPNHNPIVFRVVPSGSFSVMRYFTLRNGTSYAIGDGIFQTEKEAQTYAGSLVHLDELWKVFYDGMLCMSTNRKSRAFAYRDFLIKNYKGKVDLQRVKIKT